ncbi:hypothetical protein ACHAQA_002062 [Verticillium albo-atrum]
MESSLAYHEPSITTIVILSSFLILLNIVNHGLDKLLYCGLIGQVLLGIAWGTPGSQWLERDVQDAVMQLGYLGLLLIVYEGGLATSFQSLKANILLSIGVAVTGIAVPMGLSFVLVPMMGVSPLQAFAAGAALCSTSLGTTFTILGTSGLSSTRLGVVLTSAAMMDDVVGLIMVQVISNLGGDAFDIITVIRPICVSLAFAVVSPLVCRFVVLPLTIHVNTARETSRGGRLDHLLSLQQTAFIFHTFILIGLVAGGTYAGTSGLFTAYIAGASISWWDSEVPHPPSGTTPLQTSISQDEALSNEAPTSSEDEAISSTRKDQEISTSGMAIYQKYYGKAVEHILKPFFFASIGFSIPVTRMFSGPIVWRGMVYSVLMVLGKTVCGLWLISYMSPLHAMQQFAQKLSLLGRKKQAKLGPGSQCEGSSSNEGAVMEPPRQAEGVTESIPLDPSTPTSQAASTPPINASPDPEMPVSLYPACIIAFAMVARGEIGFLISALAETNGVFGRHQSDREPSELFLVVTWAIALCTIGGPVCVGLLLLKSSWDREVRERVLAKQLESNAIFSEADIEDAAQLLMQQELELEASQDQQPPEEVDDMMVDEMALQEENELDALLMAYNEPTNDQQMASGAHADANSMSDDEDYDALFMDLVSQQDPSQQMDMS